MFNLRSICLALLIPTALASTTPLVARQDTATPQQYTIDGLYIRKTGGVITTLGFHVWTQNGDFDCAPYQNNAPATGFAEDTLYACGRYSGYFFAYYQASNTLYFKYGENPTNNYVGAGILPNVCRAGGNGPTDQVCDGVGSTQIILAKSPSK